MKTLSGFIAEIGDEAAAALFDVKLRTVASWRRGERFPRRDQALRIVDRSKSHPHGPVTFAGIYQREAA